MATLLTVLLVNDHNLDAPGHAAFLKKEFLDTLGRQRDSLAFQPMTQEQVRRCLTDAKVELAALGVRSLDLFGSVARGEARVDSDVDLLVEFDRPVGLFHFFHVQRRLEQILGARVDLVMRAAVKPQLRERIFAEAIRAA
jgi:uncharacterized protein